VLEFAQTIIRLCNASQNINATPEIIFESSRVDDPERRRPNIDKAKRVLGWQPQVSMEEGLKRSIKWFSKRAEHLSTVI
jgi:nucleoside-diphosphate-sugar epimerase